MGKKGSLDYKLSGVDIDSANEFVKRIKPIVESTWDKNVLKNFGSFAALYKLKCKDYKSPEVAQGTDGVGTKIHVAVMMEKYDTIGIDLVAMSVNDVITCGAKPLTFLDYISTSKVDVEREVEIVKGIAEGCKIAGCSLLGGELAEMLGFYKKGMFDLAGFATGIVEANEKIEGKDIKEGDIIIGLHSNGLHSNGYSLVRKLFFKNLKMKCSDYVKDFGCALGEELLRPTKIYVDVIDNVKKDVKGIAHITGGGFIDNIPRAMPPDLVALINENSWPVLPIFDYIQKKGKIAREEMYRTFNMGIGMVLIADKDSGILSKLKDYSVIGEIKKEGKVIFC